MKLLFVATLLFLALNGYSQDLFTFLKSQPSICEITEIPGNDFFSKTYQIMVRQPLDYADTTAGYFLQRVFVADKSADRPVVFITEGYNANYAKHPNFINELSQILDANQICVEHRYFGESVPNPIVWEHLTVENAANDHHRIVELFKKYYQKKWLNTGISKGGQTALAHRTFFPNDVNMTVAYVAPLNFGVEDGRHEPFLSQVGSELSREKIRYFQFEILKRRNQILPLLKAYSESHNYHYPITPNEVLDFIVLEYPFAFWQWGHSDSEIPGPESDDKTLFEHLTQVSSPDYFSTEGSAPFQPFFYQAARELGYYGYDTLPFQDLLSIHSAKNYLNRFMVPDTKTVCYHPKTSLMVNNFLRKKAKNILLIYGETDPWTASSANVRKRGHNQKIILPEGNHKTRIQNLPESHKNILIKSIKKIMQKPSRRKGLSRKQKEYNNSGKPILKHTPQKILSNAQ